MQELTQSKTGEELLGGRCCLRLILLFLTPEQKQNSMPLFILFLLTRSEWISFSLVHRIALGNVVELRQPTKLLPDSIIVEKGSHGILYVPN